MQIEPSPKRIRAYLGGLCLLDTVRAQLVWEHPHYPTYYIPIDDVRPGAPPATESASPELRGLVRFSWDAFEAWFEEDEEVFVHAHDPHKRIDILASSRHVLVRAGEVVLAETRRPILLFETSLPVRYYLPKTDVRMHLLAPLAKRTGCAYKGFASYWSYRGEAVAWSYPMPLPEAAKIAGRIAFNPEGVELFVDGARVP